MPSYNYFAAVTYEGTRKAVASSCGVDMQRFAVVI